MLKKQRAKTNLHTNKKKSQMTNEFCFVSRLIEYTLYRRHLQDNKLRNLTVLKFSPSAPPFSKKKISKSLLIRSIPMKIEGRQHFGKLIRRSIFFWCTLCHLSIIGYQRRYSSRFLNPSSLGFGTPCLYRTNSGIFEEKIEIIIS